MDDILRTGSKLAEMKRLLESRGATVVGLAVVIYQPTPETYDFGNLPLYYLAKLDASYSPDAQPANSASSGVPLTKVGDIASDAGSRLQQCFVCLIVAVAALPARRCAPACPH